MELILSISIFLGAGFAFVLVNLLIGAIVRPNTPNPEKSSIYECGEPTIGSSWIQFDIRFYVVALFYLIFDVEIALIWPLAIVFRQHASPAIIIAGIFMAVIIIGFIYEWYTGSLDWIRSSIKTRGVQQADSDSSSSSPSLSPAPASITGHLNISGLAGSKVSSYRGSAAQMAKLARVDPETLPDTK